MSSLISSLTAPSCVVDAPPEAAVWCPSEDEVAEAAAAVAPDEVAASAAVTARDVGADDEVGESPQSRSLEQLRRIK